MMMMMMMMMMMISLVNATGQEEGLMKLQNFVVNNDNNKWKNIQRMLL